MTTHDLLGTIHDWEPRILGWHPELLGFPTPTARCAHCQRAMPTECTIGYSPSTRQCLCPACVPLHPHTAEVPGLSCPWCPTQADLYPWCPYPSTKAVVAPYPASTWHPAWTPTPATPQQG